MQRERIKPRSLPFSTACSCQKDSLRSYGVVLKLQPGFALPYASPLFCCCVFFGVTLLGLLVAFMSRCSPLSSRLGALLLHVIVNKWLWLFIARFEHRPKWRTYSAVQPLHWGSPGSSRIEYSF